MMVRLNKIISVCLTFHKQVPLAYIQSARLSAVDLDLVKTYCRIVRVSDLHYDC